MPSPEDASVIIVDELQTLRTLHNYLTSGRFLISFKPPVEIHAVPNDGVLQASEESAAEDREKAAFEKYQASIKANADDNWETEWKKERKWKHNKGRKH